MRTDQNIPRIFVLSLVLFIVAACGNGNGVPTINPRPTETPSLVPSPSPTGTPTDTVIPSPAPTLTLTWTPLPTLSRVEADDVFRQWLSGTPECRFPCWAGIEPGKTNWAEAMHTLSPVLMLHPSGDYMECRFDAMCKYFTWQYQLAEKIYSGVVYSRGYWTIYSLSMGGDYLPEVNLKKILSEHGRPSQISLIVDSYNSWENPDLYVTLLFPDDKFVIQYVWKAVKKRDQILACGLPQEFNLGIVDIGANDWTNLEVQQTGNQLSRAVDSGVVTLFLLSDVTDLTDEAFYEKGLRQSFFCISTPAEDWGY
jgi:hypothetical protein